MSVIRWSPFQPDPRPCNKRKGGTETPGMCPHQGKVTMERKLEASCGHCKPRSWAPEEPNQACLQCGNQLPVSALQLIQFCYHGSNQFKKWVRLVLISYHHWGCRMGQQLWEIIGQLKILNAQLSFGGHEESVPGPSQKPRMLLVPAQKRQILSIYTPMHLKLNKFLFDGNVQMEMYRCIDGDIETDMRENVSILSSAGLVPKSYNGRSLSQKSGMQSRACSQGARTKPLEVSLPPRSALARDRRQESQLLCPTEKAGILTTALKAHSPPI